MMCYSGHAKCKLSLILCPSHCDLTRTALDWLRLRFCGHPLGKLTRDLGLGSSSSSEPQDPHVDLPQLHEPLSLVKHTIKALSRYSVQMLPGWPQTMHRHPSDVERRSDPFEAFLYSIGRTVTRPRGRMPCIRSFVE